MTKILVVDDHDLVRMGIMRMLSDVEGFEVIGEAKSGEQALTLATELTPDIILMDVNMPGIGGLEATKKLCENHPRIKIIVVTGNDDDEYPSLLLKAGAVGYVTKDTCMDEVESAIRAALDNKVYMSNHVAQQMAKSNLKKENKPLSPFMQLSERELQTAVMTSKGKKVSEISDFLCVSPKTVNSFRYRIFEKLNVKNDVELTLLAVKHGMLDPNAIV